MTERDLNLTDMWEMAGRPFVEGMPCVVVDKHDFRPDWDNALTEHFMMHFAEEALGVELVFDDSDAFEEPAWSVTRTCSEDHRMPSVFGGRQSMSRSRVECALRLLMHCKKAEDAA